MNTNTCPIRIYSTSNGTTLTLIDETQDYQNCYITRSWQGCGKFSISLYKKSPKSESFVVGRIVQFGTDVKRVGEIKAIKTVLDSDGNEKIEVSGTELKGITSKRFIVPTATEYYTASGVVETVMKSTANAFIGSTASTSRKIDAFQTATDLARGLTAALKVRYKSLYSALQELAESYLMGWTVYLDLVNKKYIFDVLPSTNRTAGQSVNPRAIFSKEWNSVKGYTIDQSGEDFINLVYIGGAGEGTARNVRTVYNSTEPTGFDRVETFSDSRSLKTDTELDTKAADILRANVFTTGIEVEPLESSALVYGVDYNLGDLVTIKAGDIEKDVYITEVKEAWGNNYQLSLIFGKPPAGLTQQIATMSSKTQEVLASTATSGTGWLPYPAGTYVFPSGNQTVAVGVLAIGAAITVPTFGTGTTKKAWYKINGNKTIDIMFTITQTTTASANGGNGIYYIPIPLASAMDTAFISMSTGFSTGSTLGQARLGFNSLINNCALTAIAVATTYFKFTYTQSSSDNVWGSGRNDPTVEPFVLSGIITGIPIL